MPTIVKYRNKYFWRWGVFRGGKENPTDNRSVGSHERRRVEKELSFYVLIIVKMSSKKFHPAQENPHQAVVNRWGLGC